MSFLSPPKAPAAPAAPPVPPLALQAEGKPKKKSTTPTFLGAEATPEFAGGAGGAGATGKTLLGQ